MKILDRYILRTFMSAVASSTIFLLGMFVVFHFLTIVSKKVDATDALQEVGLSYFEGVSRYYALHLPNIAVMFGPYATLFAAMYTVHNLNSNNELTPMFAVGVRRWRAAAPIIVATCLISLSLVATKEFLIPELSYEMGRISKLVRGDEEVLDDDVGLMRDSFGRVFSVKVWDSKQLRLIDVSMQAAHSSQVKQLEFLQWQDDAKGGRFLTPGQLNGTESPDDFVSDLHIVDIEQVRKMMRHFSYLQLKQINSIRPERLDVAVLMHGHLTYPFTAIILILLGLPFVMGNRKKKVYLGLTMCLFLSLAYFSSTLICNLMGTRGDFLDPLLGAWMTPVIFGGIGLLIFESRR